jgi:hypothetical protein
VAAGTSKQLFSVCRSLGRNTAQGYIEHCPERTAPERFLPTQSRGSLWSVCLLWQGKATTARLCNLPRAYTCAIDTFGSAMCSGRGSSTGAGLPAIANAIRVASVMIVICGFTPSEEGTMLPSATYSPS